MGSPRIARPWVSLQVSRRSGCAATRRDQPWQDRSMSIGEDLMAQPPATKLPRNDEAEKLRSDGASAEQIASTYPTDSTAWADLAAAALEQNQTITAYAYARTGYHRGLDALRRNGWKGWGSVPWAHEPNRGVLRCFHYLAQAAERIGETDEVERLNKLIDDSDPDARRHLTT
jgi:hypothetical protein